jgi:hypothetical protein
MWAAVFGIGLKPERGGGSFVKHGRDVFCFNGASRAHQNAEMVMWHLQNLNLL